MIARIADLSNVPADLRGGVVAIGNFDGVHRGHQQVLEQALEIADRAGVAASVLTFEPHPRALFAPDTPLFRLTPAPLKARLLDSLGFSAVFEQTFDKDFSENSAEHFIEEILIGCLQASHIVTGFNFHFGKGRRGTPDMLRDLGNSLGFGVTVVAGFEDEGGETVSSTRIRQLLADGEVVQAAGLLGYRYSVCSEIIHGKKLGRTLGFPTANMALPPETALEPGVYAVRLRRSDGTLHDGVASFGRRPTTDDPGAPLLLETYVFDAAPDLYGEVCTVSLFGYLRPEQKFDSLDALVVQMKEDEAEARAVLAGVQSVSPFDRSICF